MTSQYLLHQKLAAFFVALMGLSLVTTVAGTNIIVLLLVLVAPWAYFEFRKVKAVSGKEREFFVLLLAICIWDVATNMYAGHALKESLTALIHDMRTIGFILILWPIFSIGLIARTGLWAITLVVVGLATANLLLTLFGVLSPGTYFWSTAPHMYGQMLVGIFFLLAQLLLMRPELGWRCALPMLLLLVSLFHASERRTGYLLFFAGSLLWGALNFYRVKAFKNRHYLFGAIVLIILVVVASPVVQRRVVAIFYEVQQFIGQTVEQRTAKETAVGIRLQYYVSVWQLINQNSWLTGVGSIDFPQKFWFINQSMGALDPKLFSNPHNEYLYMLATKGLIGLFLYLAIFAQACRLAWDKKDELQCTILLVFVFMFMISITTNSMMIDMEEGHFTMLILLIFLAPSSLEFVSSKPNVIESI